MTLHELFTSVNEKALFNSFHRFYPQIKSTGYMNNFRFLLHSLMEIAPGVPDEEIVEIDYNDRFWHEQGFAAWFNINKGWQVLLARNVIVVPDLQYLTKDDIAALCLWRVAFLDFSEEQRLRYKDYQLDKEGYEHHERFLCNQREFNGFPALMPPTPPIGKLQLLKLKQLYINDCIEETCEYVKRHQIEGIVADSLWELSKANEFFIYDFPYSSYFSKSDIISSYKSLLADFTNTHNYHNIFLISHAEDNNTISELVSYIQNSFPNPKIYYGTNSPKGITMRLIQYSYQK